MSLTAGTDYITMDLILCVIYRNLLRDCVYGSFRGRVCGYFHILSLSLVIYEGQDRILTQNWASH